MDSQVVYIQGKHPQTRLNTISRIWKAFQSGFWRSWCFP